MKIDWNEAPDATHYDKRKGAIPAFMRKAADGSGWEFRQTNGGWMYYGELTDEQVAKLKKRPAPWTGEGLPPVGTTCEYLWQWSDKVVYARIKVLSNDEERAQFRILSGGGIGSLRECNQRMENGLPMFRPIRTPEQIAAEERAKLIKAALADVKGCRSFPGDIVRGNITLSVVEAMIDAGYHKQVKP